MVEDRDAEVVIMQNIISSEVPHQSHHIQDPAYQYHHRDEIKQRNLPDLVAAAPCHKCSDVVEGEEDHCTIERGEGDQQAEKNFLLRDG